MQLIELELLRVGICAGSYLGCKQKAVGFFLVSHLKVCEDDPEILFFFFPFSLEKIFIFIEIFGFLSQSFSFANPLAPFFSVLVIPEGKGNFASTLELILSGSVREGFIGKGFIFFLGVMGIEVLISLPSSLVTLNPGKSMPWEELRSCSRSIIGFNKYRDVETAVI